MKELTTMLSFDHPNVMMLNGMCLDRKAPLIIMPFMSNGSVLEYVRQHKHELFLTTESSDTKVKVVCRVNKMNTARFYTHFPNSLLTGGNS